MTDQQTCRACRTVLFICPRTGHTVQGFLANELFDTIEPDRYAPISCIACSETHFVNLTTGALLGAEAKPR